jgi:hypothetical protein
MAVTLFARVPALTVERYDGLMAGLELDANPPPGLILHVATESVGSINILEAWQTEQAARSFAENRLRDALLTNGVKEPLAYRIDPMHNLFAPDMDMIGRIGGVSVPVGSSGRSALAS